MKKRKLNKILELNKVKISNLIGIKGGVLNDYTKYCSVNCSNDCSEVGCPTGIGCTIS